LDSLIETEKVDESFRLSDERVSVFGVSRKRPIIESERFHIVSEAAIARAIFLLCPRSFGSQLLERETMAMVERAQSLPLPPKLPGRQIVTIMPIRYNIR
jgi:hypothetical protein